MDEHAETAAWLVGKTGSSVGRRYLIRDSTTRVGRDPRNEVVLQGTECAVVSSQHMEIRRDGEIYQLRDLNSTNGTYVNGQRATQVALESGHLIRLGLAGPEFEFVIGGPVPPEQTIGAPSVEDPPSSHDELLTTAVRRARQLRRQGAHGQTTIIMRQMLATALHRSGRRLRRIILALVVGLVAVSVYAAWRITLLRREQGDIDRSIAQIEERLEKGGLAPEETDALVEKLDAFQKQARQLQDNLFYRFSVERQGAFVEQEVLALLAEFGAEQYRVPSEFVQQVEFYLKRYQEEERATLTAVLGANRKNIGIMRSVLQKNSLPPDLAYMVLVESSFIRQSESREGAVGLWQFTPATARAYGMRVDGKVDERYDLRKSTQAASNYIRELILDFGSGSSVMLALAAYNLGPGKVKRAVRRVRDPIKQRDFWYLYRTRALPLETRQYVPKTFAAMIIGRSPERFGI